MEKNNENYYVGLGARGAQEHIFLEGPPRKVLHRKVSLEYRVLGLCFWFRACSLASKCNVEAVALRVQGLKLWRFRTQIF